MVWNTKICARWDCPQQPITIHPSVGMQFLFSQPYRWRKFMRHSQLHKLDPLGRYKCIYYYKSIKWIEIFWWKLIHKVFQVSVINAKIIQVTRIVSGALGMVVNSCSFLFWSGNRFIRACDKLPVREAVNIPFFIEWYNIYPYDAQPQLNLNK